MGRLGLSLGIVLFMRGVLLAQLTTGTIEGVFHSVDGRPVSGSPILITGATGFRTIIQPDSQGEFAVTLPYGRYSVSGATILVAPFQITRLDLVIDSSGSIRSVQPTTTTTPGIWTHTTGGRTYPEAFSLQGLLLSREPSSVTEPLNFAGLSDNRLALESRRGVSWTDMQYRLQGMDSTDSYQPGLPVVMPDIQALDEVVVRSAFAQPNASNYGTEAGLFVAESGFAWHGAILAAVTGSALSSTNLPPPVSRGLVQQPDQFRWFTRDGVRIGGPLTRRADFFGSATGQWASQTEPLKIPGADQDSRWLSGNARGRIRASPQDQLDALYNGSRIDLSDGGIPAGLEAFTGNRMAPSFVLPGGFPGERETDHFDLVQVGWTHLPAAASGFGVFEVRYGYSMAHLDTSTDPHGLSRVELLDGVTTGAPPLGNLAVRTRQEIEVSWQPAVLRAGATRHRIAAGVGWKTSEPRNRFTTPSDMNLITADGAPAFSTQFNTPVDSHEIVRALSGALTDHVSFTPSLSLDLGIFADFSRGSLPAQSSPSGTFATARTFAVQPDLIVWNSVSPHAGFAWRVPHSHGLVVGGTYFRLYAPLTGRDLDLGNPNSLGGSLYQSTPGAAPGITPQPGALVLRFGGPYSSIAPGLHRPYSDEFDVNAEYPFAPRSLASIHLFRRDTKNRLAAIDTGIPASAFTPVSILDPGPDGIPGTFDDQRLTVYAQNPATFGQDRYLLTNPDGLRMLNTGFMAEISTEWRGLMFHASFVAEKSYGPTNPGNGVYENDPGVLGALFLDPNTSIHASGRSFVDRAYVGKIQASYRLPPRWGGIDLASVADYLDGLVFARQLLVTGLPQGPFLVATTVRGSPEGGNRAQYVINWNLRLSRGFALPTGRFVASADIFNVINAGQRLQENDLNGPLFNLRLPVSIQPPRFVRFEFRYEF